jgi:hypothetical protein
MTAILICTDGFAAYPKSILRAFREKVKNPYGIGAPRKEVWQRLYIGTVIKHMAKRRVTEVVRWMTYGQWRKAKRLDICIERRKEVEYLIHRASEWNLSRASCFSHAEMPTCSFKNGNGSCWNIPYWMHI